MIVSPMAAGGVVRDRIDGFVIPPYDEEGWIDALRALTESPDLRRHVGNSARQQASEFTWNKVGQRRARAIVERLCGNAASEVLSSC